MSCPVLVDDAFWPIVVVTLTGELSARSLARELALMQRRSDGGARGPFALVLDTRHGALAGDADRDLIEAHNLIGRAVVGRGGPSDDADDGNNHDDDERAGELWARFASIDDAFGWCLARVTADAHARYGPRAGSRGG